jgi:hypothetical protein
MFTGRSYLLGKATLALELVNGARKLHTVPAEAVIQVLSGPSQTDNDALVKVLWNGKIVSMFAVDIAKRGTLLRGESASA